MAWAGGRRGSASPGIRMGRGWLGTARGLGVVEDRGGGLAAWLWERMNAGGRAGARVEV